MLVKEEANIVKNACQSWPGGLGCVLLTDNSKKGFKVADWGWKGKIIGDFDYSHLSQFENHLLCPVTALGVLKGANNFQDHMKMYQLINVTLSVLLHREYEEIKKIYNFLLSHYPLSLSCIFDDYIQEKLIEGRPLSSIGSGYYAELHTSTRKGPISVPVAIMAADENTIWTVDEVAFTREGKSKNPRSKNYILEWK